MKSSKTIFLLIFLAALISGCQPKTEASAPNTAPEILAEYESVKIQISEEGLYRIYLSDLGWDKAVADTLAITHRDQPIPVFVETDDKGVAIIFYGQASNSPYTPVNVYILQQNADLVQSIPEKQIFDPAGSPVNYLISTVHIEENHLYTPKVEDGSPWHWSKILAPQSQSVEVDLPNALDGAGNLRVALWGVTSAPTTPDHHIRVSINGQNVGEAAWDGSVAHTLDVEIPEGILVNGKNTVAISSDRRE